MPDDFVVNTEDMPFLQDLAEESPVLTPESKARSAKEQRDCMEITCSLDRTYITLIAVHRDSSRNTIHKIPCKKCIPIGGYVHDVVTDSYVLSCTDYIVLGYLPISLKARIQGIGSFVMTLPMCESVVKRFLSSSQKKDMRSFRSVYKTEDHHLQFVQMLDANP